MSKLFKASCLVGAFSNHEIWHECAKCGRWFDLRMNPDGCCPDCGTNLNAMP
jgi:rRNA maturation endonuclease Nob1